MKKVLLLIAIALMLVACNDEGNTTVTNDSTYKVPELATPKNMQAVAYPGVTFVSWDPTKDAHSYDVYRRDLQTGNVVKLTTIASGAATEYADKVSFTNQLVGGRGYSYIVIANSNRSTTSTSITDELKDLMLNSEAVVSVGANVPDRNYYVIEKPINVKVEKYTKFTGASSADYLVVTWVAEPYLDYDVVYSYGTTTGTQINPGTVYSISKTVTGLHKPIGYAEFPLVGGTNAITVTPKFMGGTDYYANVKSESVKEDFAYTAVVAPATFTAVRVVNDETTVQFAWGNVSDEHNNKFIYKVYKAEISDDTASATNGVTTISDWSEVSYTNAQLVGGTWYAIEKNISLDKHYAYMIVCELSTGAAKSKGLVATVSAETFTTSNITNIVAYNVSTTPNVEITWTATPGIDYDLYRAEVTFAPRTVVLSTTVPLTEGTYTKLTAGYNMLGNTAVATDDGVTKRKYYRYKLVAKRGTKEAEATYYNLVNPAFALTGNFSFTAAKNGAVVDITVNPGSTYMDDKPEFKVYRRNMTAGEISVFTEVGTMTYTGVVLDVYSDGTGLVAGKTYEYVITATIGGKELYSASMTAQSLTF